MSNTNVDYNKRLKTFKEIYPQILEMSLAEKSPFGEFKKLLEQFGNDNVIRNDQQFQSLAQALVSVGQTIVAQSQNTALSMILQGDENELNAEKALLLRAQTETEKAKPALIARQTAQIDDILRIEAAKVTQNVQFGYCAGGLDIPQEIMKLVKEKIKNIEKFS
ncbi:hypothetical protein ACFKQF_000245 [Campylobacter jejuni]|nr:hypothetical protein [Campylobacter jejuni]EAI9678566.1 hypothetical protein [Campylobacter coli]EAK4065319.1 hypothetical protein [Campylobacter coli]ECZ7614098.1 hypothetical protein [Campylobacter coli]EGK8159703.1 hypothetical protein [Campylobacter coli]